MKRYIAVVTIMMALSCTNAEKKTALSTDSAAVGAQDIKVASVEFGDQKIQSIYNDYIGLKDALVASKYEEAKPAAEKLQVSLSAYKGCENTALISGKIADAKDIATQRKEFTSLSADVIALFKHTDVKNGSLYVQHCPMANNGDGGDWLASEKKIQNPYYGDEMMECGRVVEEIKTASN